MPSVAASQDYKIKDIALAEAGRKEIDISEPEMPGLMAAPRAVRPTRSPSPAPASPAAST